MVKFASNNTLIHSSTQQTPLFSNHGLHPKFDIQSVNNFVNLATKNRAMWLVDIQMQLGSKLRNVQKYYKENVNDSHKKLTKLQG
jgi:hypothetical protein